MKGSNDITKLPKWAQHEITRLRADLKDSKNKESAALGETKTRIMIGGPFDPRGYLGERESVSFNFAPYNWVDVSLRSNYRKLESVYINGSGTLIAEPSASNCLYIRVEK